MSEPVRVQVSSGAALFSRATQHDGEPYTLGSLVPKSARSWAGPWDCAEFVAWCLYQETGVLFGCSNTTDPDTADAYTGFFADQSTAGAIPEWGSTFTGKGNRCTLELAFGTIGAALLRLPIKGPKVSIGHVAISDGQGGTIEAHSTKEGVTAKKATGRRWDYGILLPNISYTLASKPAGEPVPDVLRVQSPAVIGAAVLRVQQALRAHGYDVGEIDGVFGPRTHAAVQAFQQKNGRLVVDGEVGPATARALGVKL